MRRTSLKKKNCFVQLFCATIHVEIQCISRKIKLNHYHYPNLKDKKLVSPLIVVLCQANHSSNLFSPNDQCVGYKIYHVFNICIHPLT